MRRQKQQGVILLCTLAIMVILSILLMVGVHRMQTSTMMTKRAIWEIKSYWAAKAGNTIAADGCIRSVQWPDTKLIKQAGGYTIKLSSDKNCVEGTDDDSGSSFNIYFINKLLNSYTRKSSNVEATLQKNFDNFDGKMTAGEFYALTSGKSGASVVGLELLYALSYNPNTSSSDINQDSMTAEQATSASACIYSAGSIVANIGGIFHIGASGNTRPTIVTGGSVTINGNGGGPDSYGRGPLDMDEGALFCSGATLNGTHISPSNSNNNLVQYGINVYSLNGGVSGNSLSNYSVANNGLPLPSGTFCFIEMPQGGNGGNYEGEEYESAIRSVMDLYLSPKDFFTIYKEEMASLVNEDIQLAEKFIDRDDIKLIKCYSGCEEKFESYFNDRCKPFFQDEIKEVLGEALDKAASTTSASDQAEAGREAHEINTSIKMLEKLYKNYLRNVVNNFVDSYKKSGADKDYDAFFIPDGNAGISGAIGGRSCVLQYSQMTRARVLGILDEYVNPFGDVKSKITDDSLNIFSKMGLDSSIFKASKEKSKVSDNLKKYEGNSINGETYIADRVKISSGDMFVLNKLAEHKSGSKYGFEASANSIYFDKKELEIGFKSNVQSKGYFNFAAFDRRGNTSGEYWYANEQQGDYGLANGQHVGVHLDNTTLVGTNDISIKGFVYGQGALNAKSGNVIFDALGSNVSNSQQDVSIVSQSGNIKITKSSGADSGNSFDMQGVIFAQGNLDINAGGGIDFNHTGSIVCNGTMNISNVNNVNIEYNPQASRIIINQSLPIYKKGEDNQWGYDEDGIASAVESGNSNLINTGTFKLFNRI